LNAVSPGVIEVPAQGTSSAKPHADDIPAILQTIPMSRLGLPVEVAQAVLWLLSSDAAYVTGTVLAVAGGR
jgi:NAD(P)-dependent dehydrogenase (short-subunit alcohol dehydrogenase family)